jgi:hypothetical protein
VVDHVVSGLHLLLHLQVSLDYHLLSPDDRLLPLGNRHL